MALQTILQKLIILTNSFWPFSTLNKLPYRFALWRFKNFCSKFSEIKGAYIRHSLLEQNWEPGLSDIDLTVIIKDGLDSEREFDFIQNFWKQFKRLKHWLPMLSDVIILSETQFPVWVKYSDRGNEFQNWQPITDFNPESELNCGNPLSEIQDDFSFSYTIYQWVFWQLFYKLPRGAFLTHRQLNRVANKIIRFCSGVTDSCHYSMKLEAIIAQIIVNLENALKQKKHSIFNSSVFESGLYPEWQKSTPNCGYIADKLQPISKHIECIYRTSDNDYIILHDTLSITEIENTVAYIINPASNNLNKPLVLTRKLFEYLLSQHTPDIYANLRWERTLLLGRDILAEISPPPISATERQQERQISNIISFVRSEILFSESKILADKISRMAIHSLCLKLRWQKNIILPYNSQRVWEIAKCFPADYAIQKEIAERKIDLNTQDGRMLCFFFLNRLANEICSLSLRAGDLQNKTSVDALAPNEADV